MKLVHINALFLAILLLILPLGTVKDVYAAENAENSSPQSILEPLQLGIKSFSESLDTPKPSKIQLGSKKQQEENAEEPSTGSWNFILVNEWNPLPEDFTVALVTLEGGERVDYRVQQPLSQMMQDAAAEGITLTIRSGYRSVALQDNLYQQKVLEYRNTGLTLENAQEQARQWVARPGRSEHHTGLAIDINTTQQSNSGFGGTDAFRWLSKHCDEYGFIIRYPEGKTGITGVGWEPWHFRYVGKDAAKQIMKDGITLEEFLNEKNGKTAEKKPVNSAQDSTAWNLLLVNEWNPIPKDFTVSLVSITGGEQVDSRIQQPLSQMIQDAAAQGVSLMVCSGYRTVSYQDTLFQRKVRAYQNYGLDLASAQEQARQWVARPSRSEHHTGLAVDIVTPSYQVLDSGFAETAAAKWLLNHSAEYGFILRYPAGKTDITGVAWEPWHFRYVGADAAKQITEDGICLEEFLDGQNS